MPHTCHAYKCNVKVSPKLFMCLKHWYMLSQSERNSVWANYVPGQEIRKDPTEAYCEITDEIIKALATREYGVYGK